MKRLRSKLLLLLLVAATSLSARPSLEKLNIQVVLSHNGDARITETRIMDIDDEGTECYIGLANMGGSEVRDLEVSDETGLKYENIGSWDVDRSRSWKAGKCGIVYKGNGYEVCWGLGESGKRVYTTSYTITSLVHAYPDADGIRHIFLAEDVSPKPDEALLTIEAEDSLLFSEENCGIWGFRFGGELGFSEGKIAVYNTEPFGNRGALYIMVRFDKDLFEPTIQEDETFEHKKEQAFEGSDYANYDEDEETWPVMLFGIIYIAMALTPIIAFIWRLVCVSRARRRVNKNLMWYRDIPLNGDLQEANNMLNAYKYFGTNYNDLMSACILKLINQGAITIETRPNMKGKMEQNFVINDLKDKDKQPILVRKIYDIFKQAAGADTVLEPKELKQYMRSSIHQSVIDSFINTLHSTTKLSKYKNREDEVRQVFGLKKFLKDFTLLDERELKEVKLWKDYMIYATLFGIADKVIKEMKKVNPAYFDMDKVAGQMADDMTLPTIYSTLHRSTSSAVAAKAAREHRSSGGGGHSSWGGGGGGFSGGGGGGVR